MLKKIAVVGGIVAIAGLGLGGAAWAESNSSTPQAVADSSAGLAVPAAPTTAAISTSAPPGAVAKAGKAKSGNGKHGNRAALVRRLERVSHAQWVTKDGKTGTFVTHDAVRGIVSAVSGGSITIKATDGTSMTFAVNSATKVHVKGATPGAAKAIGTISQVKIGDRAVALGTGSGAKTATRVMDRGVPKPRTATSTAPTTS
jgi:hypothetical protein